MLKLSKKSEYALMAARYMAIKNHGSAVTAKEIADNYKISFELVAKVLQNLAKNNIAISYQGVKGGYTLKKNPFEISLIDLIKAVEPNYQITECLIINSEKDDCSYLDCCKIRDPLIEVQKKIDKVFYETKLAHII
ncbi:MAG: Rrf2 family transcriptional regulator [Ignavibacteriales bacterium]|nr:Rrf2 family transcriptional regulator [Ignavibacteriales bacterium]